MGGGAAGGRLFAVAGRAVVVSGGVSNVSREADGRDREKKSRIKS